MLRIFLAAITCFGVSGCSGTESTSGSPAQNASSSESVSDSGKAIVASEPQMSDGDPATVKSPALSDTGSFRGVVTFKGDVPNPRVIQATKDPEYCSAGEGEVQDVVVKNGKLAGAVVEITVKGEDLPEFVAPEDGFVIRQKDCRFEPRLVVAYSGAELVVYNDDKVEHNVNTGGWNLLQSPGSAAIRQRVNYGGVPFMRVTCNIHSWMESWVYLAKSPFYAASDEKGEFVIEGIPVGTKLRGTITHSTLGKQRFTIDVEATKPAQKTFVFEAK